MRPARLLSVPTKSEWETLNFGGEIFRGNPPEMRSGAMESSWVKAALSGGLDLGKVRSL